MPLLVAEFMSTHQAMIYWEVIFDDGGSRACTITT